MTYKAAADEEDGDGDVLEVLGTVFSSPVTEMLEEDVGRAVEKDEEALNELGRRAPFLTWLLRSDVPRLAANQITALARLWSSTHPSKLAEAARPSSQREQPQPEEDAAFNPMRESRENAVALLRIVRTPLFHPISG